MADFEESISKTLSIRGKEWQTLKCQEVKHFLLEVRNGMTDHFTSLTPIYMTDNFTTLTPICMTDHFTCLTPIYIVHA
jgi:hypothetical protein